MRLGLIETQPQGGLLHYAVQLGEALAARGHTVDLITPRGNELVRYPKRARMRAVLTPTVRIGATASIPVKTWRRLVGRARVGVRLARAWARAVVEAQRGHYDVVVIDADLLYSPAAIGAWMISRLPSRASTVAICHNVQAFKRGAQKGLLGTAPFLQWVLRRVYERLDLVFVHGERIRSEFESLFPDSKVEVIPHGDERLFGGEPPAPSTEENTLFFGYWRKVKGLGVLMNAFDLVAAKRPAATLTVAGKPFPEDFDLPAIRRWAEGHGGRVELIERYIPIEEVEALFSRARVVVAPYLTGYQSGVIHLAMTMGRPVVASDVGEHHSVVVDGQTGFLVAPGSVEELAGALERILGNPDLAARFGAAGRQRVVEGSSWESVAERFEATLAALWSSGSLSQPDQPTGS